MQRFIFLFTIVCFLSQSIPVYTSNNYKEQSAFQVVSIDYGKTTLDEQYTKAVLKNPYIQGLLEWAEPVIKKDDTRLTITIKDTNTQQRQTIVLPVAKHFMDLMKIKVTPFAGLRRSIHKIGSVRPSEVHRKEKELREIITIPALKKYKRTLRYDKYKKKFRQLIALAHYVDSDYYWPLLKLYSQECELVFKEELAYLTDTTHRRQIALLVGRDIMRDMPIKATDLGVLNPVIIQDLKEYRFTDQTQKLQYLADTFSSASFAVDVLEVQARDFFYEFSLCNKLALIKLLGDCMQVQEKYRKKSLEKARFQAEEKWEKLVITSVCYFAVFGFCNMMFNKYHATGTFLDFSIFYRVLMHPAYIMIFAATLWCEHYNGFTIEDCLKNEIPPDFLLQSVLWAPLQQLYCVYDALKIRFWHPRVRKIQQQQQMLLRLHNEFKKNI